MRLRQRFALWLYRLLWYPALPIVLIYFRLRGRKDVAYRDHMDERFGRGAPFDATVWIHAVSLGEFRSAMPLVTALLSRGETVLITHLTPAGRRASESALAEEIAAGHVAIRYLPLELGFAWRRFFRACRPRIGLSMEIEIWPVMIDEARRAGVPLWLANSQIPEKSFLRACRWLPLIGHPVRGVAGVMAKSDIMADRFRALGAPNVHVTGELRFDQPIPARLLDAARDLTTTPTGALLRARHVVALASVVEGEDDQYLAAYRIIQQRFSAAGRPAPLFIHIPRAPERFAAVGDMLEAQGQKVVRRSRVFDTALTLTDPALAEADILLGDSLGEMYFYLALADLAVVGGGFVEKGAHNVIEPLALRRPVLVGPHVWTIEYPGREAEAAGVMRICPTIADLAQDAGDLIADPAALNAISTRTEAFFAAHSGATRRSMEILSPLLEADR